MHTEKEPLIKLSNVSFSYKGDSAVLENIDISVSAGEYVGIIGPNGAGKTTLIKLILGLLTPTRGRISLLHPQHAGSICIGYVPQRSSYAGNFFPASVYEIVLSGRAALRGLMHFYTQTDREKTIAAMRLTGIEDLRDRRIDELSGGQRQRVFIARALAIEPHVLILDEPTTGVDMNSQNDFYAFLRKLHKDKHLTILMVTHDIDVVTKETQSVLCINKTLRCSLPSGQFNKAKYLRDVYGHEVHLVHHDH